ncbi:MAG TPA: class I SAM-dependent methyltransferase [Phycisphaerae bacterium]
MVVADVGAGTGLFTEPLARAVGPKGKVIAVDIVPLFLEHIRQRAAEAGLSNVSTVLCKEDSVEVPADSIDLAFVCDTYHHFEYPKSTLRSIHTALRAGGQLIIVDFKRIPGVSRAWVLEHVRAGQDEVTAEIRAAGFELVSQGSEAPYLDENYLLRFRKR